MTTGFTAPLALDQGRLGRVDDWMQSYVDAHKFAGSSALIFQGGREVYFNTAGLRDREAGHAFERGTVARIYSMTKPITSAAIMMLVERGLFHLDAPISDFIPAFANPVALIPGATDIGQTVPCAVPTVHQLLTHTAGMSYPFNPGILAQEMAEKDILFRSDDVSLADMVDRAAALPLAFEPGSRWEYSVSIDILGRIVEIVSGQTLGTFFQSEIFAPLGMTQTGFSVRTDQRANFAALYTPLEDSAFALGKTSLNGETLRLVDAPDASPFLNATLQSGGGGLVGTIDDYMRFCEAIRLGGALDGVRILSTASTEFMCRNHLAGDIASMGVASFAEQPMDGMGFGLGGAVVLDPARARVPGSVGDYSWGGMASTFFWIDPVHDLSVVFFTQLAPSSSYPARAELKALVHGALL